MIPPASPQSPQCLAQRAFCRHKHYLSVMIAPIAPSAQQCQHALRCSVCMKSVALPQLATFHGCLHEHSNCSSRGTPTMVFVGKLKTLYELGGTGIRKRIEGFPGEEVTKSYHHDLGDWMTSRPCSKTRHLIVLDQLRRQWESSTRKPA
jgi:hypothetical protein